MTKNLSSGSDINDGQLLKVNSAAKCYHECRFLFNDIITTSSSSSRVLSCLLVRIISALKIAKWKCRKTFIMFCSCEGQEERRVVFCGIGHLQGWGDAKFDNIDGFYWWLWKPSQVGDVWLWGNCWLKHQVTRKDQTWCHCHHCHNQYNDHYYNHHKNHCSNHFNDHRHTTGGSLKQQAPPIEGLGGWKRAMWPPESHNRGTFPPSSLVSAACMTLLSQNPLTVSTTQRSTTYWTTTLSTTSTTTTTTTTTTTSTTTKPPVMLYNDHIVVSTDPDALATYGSILSGTWEIPQGQEKKHFSAFKNNQGSTQPPPWPPWSWVTTEKPPPGQTMKQKKHRKTTPHSTTFFSVNRNNRKPPKCKKKTLWGAFFLQPI